jgi:hypothetical protein
VGSDINFLLGWLLYGIVFESQFPVIDGEVMSIPMIAIGRIITSLF